MATSSLIQQAADRLWEAELQHQVCEPIRDIIGAEDIEAAYAAQQINRVRRLAEGAQIVGYKIGLTSASVQAQFGVFQPDFGHLYGDREVRNGGHFNSQHILQPRAEAEVALVLGADLDSQSIDLPAFEAAIAYASPAIEIVGSRIRDWDIRITDTIADNASASHFVLGASQIPLADLDLVNLSVELFQNETSVSLGKGADCMGNPLVSGLWLAKAMIERGANLKKGDLILTGAIGRMVPIAAGYAFRADFGPLGTVSVQFS